MRGSKLFKALDAVAGGAAILLLSALPSRRAPQRPDRLDPARILVVKLAALGDTVLLIPALRALRERYPGAEIGMVGTRLNEALIAEYPQYVDRFYLLDVARATREPRYLWRFARGLRREGWAVGLDFDQWPRISPLLMRLAGAPVRIGFRTRSRLRHRLYTHPRPRRSDVHESRNFLDLLTPLGIQVEAPRLELPVRAEAVAAVRAELGRRGWDGAAPLLVVHPGCGHAHPRAWPLGSYDELCRRLEAEPERFFFVFTGAGSEAELTEPLAAALPGRSASLTTLPLAEFVACLSLAELVVSGNTGAMHLAAALGRPQVVLEGPNDPARWGPLNPRAVIVRSSCPGCPCLDMGWEFHRTDGFCMEQISVDEAFAAVVAALRGAPGSAGHLRASA